MPERENLSTLQRLVRSRGYRWGEYTFATLAIGESLTRAGVHYLHDRIPDAIGELTIGAMRAIAIITAAEQGIRRMVEDINRIDPSHES